jgi:hypothetical protein
VLSSPDFADELHRPNNKLQLVLCLRLFELHFNPVAASQSSGGGWEEEPVVKSDALESSLRDRLLKLLKM